MSRSARTCSTNATTTRCRSVTAVLVLATLHGLSEPLVALRVDHHYTL